MALESSEQHREREEGRKRGERVKGGCDGG